MLLPKLNNVNNYDRINLRNSNVIYKGKVNNLQNDMFEKQGVPEYLVLNFEQDDYEGFMEFLFNDKSNRIFNAVYQFDDASNPPKFQRNRGFDADLAVEYIMGSQKLTSNTKTYLRQLSKTSVETEIVGKVVKDLGEGVYKVCVDKFPREFILSIEDLCNYKVGDIIKAKGSLMLKLK